MQPAVENGIGSKGKWIEAILWKLKDGIDRSMLGYHGMLFSPMSGNTPNRRFTQPTGLTFIVKNAYF